MTALKLDGKLYRDEIFADLATRVAALKAKGITRDWRPCSSAMIRRPTPM